MSPGGGPDGLWCDELGPGASSSEFDEGDWWREFIASDEGQEAIEAQRAQELSEAMHDYETNKKPVELKHLATVLMNCSDDIKRLVAPLVKYEFIQRVLVTALKDCEQNSLDFNDYLHTNRLKSYLEQASAEITADPSRGHDMNEQWWTVIKKRTEIDYEDRNRHSAKRMLNTKSCLSHLQSPEALSFVLNQANLFLTMGRRKFLDGNYDSALEKFDQGQRMLEGSDIRNEHVKPLFLLLVANRAVSALKTQRFSICIESCEIILAFEPKNWKARYRLGRGLVGVGNRETEARSAFQDALAQIRADNITDFEILQSAERDCLHQLALMERDAKQTKEFNSRALQAAIARGIFQPDSKSDNAHNSQSHPPTPSLATRLAKKQVIDFQGQYLALLDDTSKPWSLMDPNCYDARLPFSDLQKFLFPICAQVMNLPATMAGLAQAERRVAALLPDETVRGNANRIFAKIQQFFYF